MRGINYFLAVARLVTANGANLFAQSVFFGCRFFGYYPFIGMSTRVNVLIATRAVAVDIGLYA